MTPEQKSGLARLMLRWPKRRQLLATLSAPSLLDLCADYEAASVALARCAQKRGADAVGIAEDYQRILRELEDEFGIALARLTSPTCGG